MQRQLDCQFQVLINKWIETLDKKLYLIQIHLYISYLSLNPMRKFATEQCETSKVDLLGTKDAQSINARKSAFSKK